jgi:iron complex transport system permease protein
MRNVQEKPKSYETRIAQKNMVLLGCGVLLILVFMFAVMTGSISLTVKEVITTLLGKGDAKMNIVVFNIRLPRVIAAILVGAMLSACGSVMQCVLQNPLASASTLGVSQGAAFGAAVGILVFGGGVLSRAGAVPVQVDSPYIVTICAFVFGSITSLVIMMLSKMKRSIGPGGLVLAGTALTSLFSAGSTLLQYFADDTALSAVVFWTFGNLGGATWTEIKIIGVVFVGVFLYFMLNRWNYNAMRAGADTAKSLGIDTRSLMTVSMVVSSLAAAITVAFVGVIGFVGLVAPHMMRKLVGDDYRFLVPASAMAGALVLIFADTFARLIIEPVILPVGAVTSFLGAPLFLILLMKGAGRAHD